MDYNFFQSIEHLISDIIWEVDENWCYTYISGRLEEYTGYTADELIGKVITSYMDEKEAERVRGIYNGLLSSKENIKDIEIRVLNKRNEIRYMLIQGIPVVDREGRFSGYRGTVKDITDKKLIEAELRSSENHLSELMNRLPGMAFRIIIINNGFKLVYADEGALQLTGYKSSDFINNELLFQSIIHPDDIDKFDNISSKIADEKKHFEVLHRIITNDSKIKWIITKGSGVYKDHALQEIDGFSFDITETVDTIEFGRFSKRWFRNLFESNPQGITIADRYGNILEANKSWREMFGYSDEDLHGLHMTDFRRDRDRKPDTMLLNALFEGTIDFVKAEERLLLRRDGSLLWCDLTAALIEDHDKNDTFVIGIYTDVTERKRIEEELKNFKEELERLVQERTEEINRLTQKVINSQEEERQRIARDLHDGVGQTILAAKYEINSFVKEKDRDNTLLKRGLELIKIASQELREVYTGLYPSMLNELGLNDTINWFKKNFLEAWGFKVVYKNTINSGLPLNISMHIYRIMQELCNNVVKHSMADTLNVSLDQQDDKIIIEISDNGKGFKIDETRKTSTGAGLINVRQRVEFLHGHIDMESMPGRTWTKIEIPMEKE